MNQESASSSSGLGNRPNSAIGAGNVEGGQCSSGGGGEGGLLDFSADEEKMGDRLLRSLLQDLKVELKSLWPPLSSEQMKCCGAGDNNNAVAAALAAKRMRAVGSKMLHMCFFFDAVKCATALLDGEIGGFGLLVNEVDGESGMAPLHHAAGAEAARCVEMLLKRRARTDQRTRDGRRLIPVELSLSRIRAKVIWNPDEHSVEDLVVQLGEKDLKAVAHLCEKTKEIGDVAYKSAVGGHVVDLAVLLATAPGRLNEVVYTDPITKEKASIYECVIKEAVAALGQPAGTSESSEKRRLLLCAFELLQLFGVIGDGENKCQDKKTIPPLIRAAKAGDEIVVEMLLKTTIDVNLTDAHGNTALHWCLRPCKGACPQRMKIMRLLLEHGARSNQKNKLGITPAHIAAENGISQAMKVLGLEDPTCITTKTEMKETPLYFAVKNDHKECVEILLSCGASTSVMNLRKQRPIDLAKSQDMRFLLTQTHISPKNRSFPASHKPNPQLQGGEPTSPTWEDLIRSCNEDRATNSNAASPTKTEICKYYGSPSGCVRGGKCFYQHGEESPRTKLSGGGTSRIDFLAGWNHVRRVFVGGLHISVNSELLQRTFEEKFGPVEDALIMGPRKGERPHSRGFGFVNFKDKKSAVAALEAQHVTIMGKRAEIKGALPRCCLLADQFQLSHHQCLQQSDDDQHHAEAGTPKEDIVEDMATIGSTEGNEDNILGNAKEEAKLELKSWVDVVCHEPPQPVVSSGTSQPQEESMPRWLGVLRKWFPGFLRRVSRTEVYALSSLKADFRSEFGIELDHQSLGFSKLSDFVKSTPDLCHAEYVPNANHMILLPVRAKPPRPRPPQPPLTSLTSATLHEPSHIDDACDNGKSKSSGEDHLLEVPSQENEPTDSHVEASKSVGNVGLRSLESSKPEKATHGGEHMVLELIAQEKNHHYQSTLFLREFDFYLNYKASVRAGRCFRCNLQRKLWANFPCRHLVWCVDCKVKVVEVVGSYIHKCIVCDYRVEKIDLIIDENLGELHAPNTWRLQSLLNRAASLKQHLPSTSAAPKRFL